MHDDRILIGEASRILAASAQTVRLWERAGVLPAIRIGGLRTFARADVERFAAERAERKSGRNQ